MVRRMEGQWKLLPDPEGRGLKEEWFKKEQEGAKETPVPGTVQQTFPGYYGLSWYWHRFSLSRGANVNERLLLRFGAVNYLSDVWLNGIRAGSHEGGETPFTLDVTSFINPKGDNLLAVRVVNITGKAMMVYTEKLPDGKGFKTGLKIDPADKPMEGMYLAEIPSGNGRNYGGIVLPVELLLVPVVRVSDAFARPEPNTGKIPLTVTVQNDEGQVMKTAVTVSVQPAHARDVEVKTTAERIFEPGENTFELEAAVSNPRLWSPEDPNLYLVTIELEAETGEGKIIRHCHTVRCGFRDFRVENGFFYLNGKRIFLRSMHTAPMFPYGWAVPSVTPDFVRRDLVYAKTAGFNTVRFLAGTALPEQIDFCDEIGLMIYEESLAGWGLADSPKMAERFDRSVREMILRDRNHPCIVIWGMLNETFDYPVFWQAVRSLSLVRELDKTRLVILNSGRIDRRPGIGSVSNPNSNEWECVWGQEEPGAPPVPQVKEFPDGLHVFLQERWAGEIHAYPGTPHEATVNPWSPVNRWYRTMGAGTKPVFLSEGGYGSQCDVVRSLLQFEQTGLGDDPHVGAALKEMKDKLEADWRKYNMDAAYPFLRDFFIDSYKFHSRQRLALFDLIRSNPNICGYSLTSMLDCIYGEGIWTFWRELKTEVVDVLADGWAALRWCLFAGPRHGYAGRKFKLEAVLANENVLSPGKYPVTFRIAGPEGVTWEKRTMVQIPEPAPGKPGPLAVPVLSTEAVLKGPAGKYVFEAYMEKGGAPAGGRLKFRLTDISSFPGLKGSVTLWGVNGKTEKWLAAHGLHTGQFSKRAPRRPAVILVGEPSGKEKEPAVWRELARRMAGGSMVVFLSPQAFKRGKDAVRWLPMANKGRCYQFGDWLYHKECVAVPHPVFEGLPDRGILDPDYYDPVLPRYIFDGQNVPDEIAAAAFSVGYSCPGYYASGLLLGLYKFGAGSFILNTFRILEHLDKHPAADRLLLNLMNYAVGKVTNKIESSPADFDAKLKDIGY